MCRTFAVIGALLLAGCTTPRAAQTTDAERVFNYQVYREASQQIARFDPGGRVREIRWNTDAKLVSFRRGDERLTFDLVTQEMRPYVESDDPAENADPDGDRRRGRRLARGRQRDRETSPDGKWIAISRDWNVIIEAANEENDDDTDDNDDDDEDDDDAKTGDASSDSDDDVSTDDEDLIRVTTDGHRKFRYGIASWVYGEELAQQSAMWWSPDSTKLVFYEFDEREVPDFLLLKGWSELRPELLQEGYPKPGEANPKAALLVYDRETGATTRLETEPADSDEEWYLYNIKFAPNGELLFSRTNRWQNVLQIVAVDLDSGALRLVVEETQETWQENRPEMRFLDDDERFIWETERTGWKQFELRHLDGRRLNALSQGDRSVDSIERIDDANGIFYYTAYDESHPLDVHFYRVNLDGSNHQQLTREPAHHAINMSPDGEWFISEYESLTEPPTAAIYDAAGDRIATLATSDREHIRHQSWPPPEVFSFTAADGETTIYGWLYLPREFDPSRSYPLLIDVYGGPESKGVRNRWRLAHPACAFGFAVAKIDNRGTGGRGKEFVSSVYLKLGDVDIQDQADSVRHLLRTRSWLDPERVGIYGHSYGGYMAALAVLKFPEVFRVAVAGAAVTDWRNYDTIYTERYLRTPQVNEAGYKEGSCLNYVDQFRGRLLLLHGMVDDNVHPNNAFQLMEKLQEQGKPFEVMFYPESGHSVGSDSNQRRWAFLHEHLIARPAELLPIATDDDDERESGDE